MRCGGSGVGCGEGGGEGVELGDGVGGDGGLGGRGGQAVDAVLEADPGYEGQGECEVEETFP